MEKLFRISKQALTPKGEVITSVRNTHNGTLSTLADVVKMIKSDEEIKKICDITRDQSVSKAERNEAKTNLPCVEFSAICNGTHSVDHIESLTGYLCFDFDDELDYQTTREVLINDKDLSPVMIFTSPSGKLKVLLRDLSLSGVSGSTANEDYRTAYIQLAVWFMDVYGLKCDTSCVNADRCTYLSNDTEVFVNPEGFVNIDLKPELTSEDEEVWQMIGSATVKGNECVNISSAKTIRHTGNNYDHERYKETLTALKDNLTKIDGEYVYDRTKRIPIGSRSNGNAVDYGFGAICGWELKWRLNFVAMFLFNNDKRKAQEFINSSFDNVSGVWNRISDAHRFSFDRTRCMPRFDILLWIIRELGFKTIKNLEYVTTIAIDNVPKVARQTSVTEKWSSIKTLYRTPLIFDDFTNMRGKDTQGNDIIFYSAVNTLSAFCPNVRVLYNGKIFAPNLFNVFVGEQATGKGEMTAPMVIMLKQFNEFINRANEYENERYNDEQAEAKRNREEGNSVSPVRPKLHFQNTISRATEAFFIRSTARNNHKLIYSNTELKDLYENNFREGGVVKTILLNVYDNHRIENNTNKAVEDGEVLGVDCPAFSCLVSSTPLYYDKFFELSREGGGDGLVSRFLTYSVQVKNYSYPDQFRETLRDDDIELYFLRWYFYNLYGKKKEYMLSQETFDYVKTKFETHMPLLLDAYADVAATRNAIRGSIVRYGCFVIRVAALIQNLFDFEDEAMNNLTNMSPCEYIERQETYIDGELQNHSMNEFVERMRNDGETLKEEYYATEMYQETPKNEPFSLDFLGGSGGGAKQKLQAEQGNTKREMKKGTIDLADLILRPLLINHINVIMAYAKDVEKNETKSVTDSTVLAKDTVLAFMGDKFTLTEYAKKYAELTGGEATNTTKCKAQRWLAKLVVEEKVKKVDTGYEKL